MGSTLEFRQAFVARLKQACDESSLIPAPNKGRQQFIANTLEVAPEAVSKWFKAVAMPRPDKIVRLAELLKVDQSWLSYGISPEMGRSERKIHARETDGAVYLVMGMVALAGGYVGVPSQKDPRSAYVDFYSTVRGSVYPTHVSLAMEIEKDHFEVLIPKEYEELHSIAVIPTASGKFDFLALPLELIQKHKKNKSGLVQVIIDRAEKKYVSGNDTWPKINSFRESVW